MKKRAIKSPLFKGANSSVLKEGVLFCAIYNLNLSAQKLNILFVCVKKIL